MVFLLWQKGEDMNELDVEHRLTAVEEKASSNVKRLNRLEPIIDEIHTMSMTMVQLVDEMKHTNESVSILNGKLDNMDERVDEMEKAPGKEWSNTKRTLFNQFLGAILTFFVVGLIWAANMAFKGGF